MELMHFGEHLVLEKFLAQLLLPLSVLTNVSACLQKYESHSINWVITFFSLDILATSKVHASLQSSKRKMALKQSRVVDMWDLQLACLLSVSQGKTIIGHRTLQHLIAFLESSALHTLCTQQQQQRVSIEEAEGLILSKQPKIPSPLYSAAAAAAATTTRLYSAIFERFFMQNCKRTNVNNGKLALKYTTTIFLSNVSNTKYHIKVLFG